MKAALWTLVALVAAIGIGLFVWISYQENERAIDACQSRHEIGSLPYYLCEERPT